MITIEKRIGETPLEALLRLRKREPRLRKEKLSYIGRLDPMAYGKMLVAVGDAENKSRHEYLYFDKEYFATFVAGIETDSGDALGLILNRSVGSNVSTNDIKEVVFGLKSVKRQMYPWLSGKTINGVKMFELYKTGKAKNFKRPNLAVSIKKVDKLNVSFITASRLRSEIMDKIRRVHGDFRQKSVLKGWSNFFKTHRRLQFQIFSFRVVVSSGTYVRCFGEYFAKKLKIPCFLLRLKRTKIIIKKCSLVTRKES